MDVVSGIIDTVNVKNEKDVLEALKHVITEEDILFESENMEDSVETEVEEIIEIIEEVDENESLQEYVENTLLQETDLHDNDNYEEISHDSQFDKSSTTEIYTFEEENATFQTQHIRKESSQLNECPYKTKRNKQLIAYDVHEDWQDEDIEHTEDIGSDIRQNDDTVNNTIRKHTQISGNRSRKSSFQSISESTVKIDKSRPTHDVASDTSNTRNADSNTHHDIVKNAENNLVYTVLDSKKQIAGRSVQDESFANTHYIKMEQLDENTIPVEGTIYYEGDNMETLYVAQAVDDNVQYQYDPETPGQNEQMWETVNSNVTQNQEEDSSSQDQIFLHEDEDGQLYFKDDNGDLQPVYLTEDGNYAIAEHSDDPDSNKEPHSESQQTSRQSVDESYILPDVEFKNTNDNKQTAVVPASALQELDNEDNTVTISLIISEDEHGQKRTQVIIPTTDNSKCNICNKSFKTSFQLLRHNRLKHAREEDITTRNFPCDLCPKRYPDQNSLARHRKTHTGDRPFQCLECHKNFPTATALRRHLTHHNSQSRPLPCIYCGRRFVEKSSLVKHEQSHLAGDHTCDICHKSFLHAADLSQHKKYHDPDKKFDCEVCGREFNRLNNLQRHMMVHQQQGANEEILSCDVCGITYKFMSSLTRHMVTTHMNPEKLRQQAEEQRRKRENNYRRYLENRKMYETQHSGGYSTKRAYHHNTRLMAGNNDETA